MKQHNFEGKLSRRGFTKAAACSVAALPFASAHYASQQLGAEAMESAGAVNAITTGPSLIFFKDHIPPIAISDGSLEVETPNFDATDTDNGRHRVYHYKANGFLRIYRVLVVVIPEDKAVAVLSYPRDFPPPQNPEVRIWLEIWDRDVYKPVHPQYPQIVIRQTPPSDITPARLILESDKPLTDLGEAHPKKEKRARKQKHGGYGDNKLFRIGKVEVSAGDPILPFPLDRNKVHVLVWFDHPE